MFYLVVFRIFFANHDLTLLAGTTHVFFATRTLISQTAQRLLSEYFRSGS